MEKSDNIKELAIALCKAQGDIKPAIKDTTNPFFKSKYADLASVWEACRGPLSNNGIFVSQHPTLEGCIVTIETMIMHISGEWMSSKLSMSSKDTSPQAIGSTITYARRYSLSSIIGISSEEDDDGNAATGNNSNLSHSKPISQGITILGMINKLAIEKFGDLDKFKVWRIDNDLPEIIDGLKDYDLAKVLTAVREYKSIPIKRG